MISVLRAIALIGLAFVAVVSTLARAADTAPPATTAAPADEETTLRRQIEAARDAYQHLIAQPSPPASATPDEILEQEHLQGALLRSLERRLDALQRLPSTLQRAAEKKAQVQEWQGFSAPPPYSILLVDQLRKAAEAAKLKLQASQAGKSLLAQQIDDGEKAFKAADIAQRQSDERFAQASTPEQRDRQGWLRDQAQLRAKVAAAAMSEARQLQAMTQAETDEVRQQIELLEKQLTVARSAMRFSQADLDGVLADIDRQRTILEKRGAQAQLAGQRSQRAWISAKQALDSARQKSDDAAAPAAARQDRAARLETLERTVTLRRTQADNDQLAYDMTLRTLDINAWERTGWQGRWLLTNSPNSDTLRDSLDKMEQFLQRLGTWDQYLQGEITRAQAERDDATHGDRQGSVNSDQLAMERQYQAALQVRVDILRTSQNAVTELSRTLQSWRQEILAHNSDRPAAAIIQDGMTQLRQTAGAIWNFELFSVEDSLQIDGRQVVAARSVTVGKSLGAILFLLFGYRFSALLSRRISDFAVRRLGAISGHATMLARWLQFVLVAMLFISTLYMLNIPLTVFAFLGGALAIGLGFGTQILLKNLVSGVMLLIERPLRVGDLIEVGSIVGRVTNIGIRSSTVRTSDGIETLIPNSAFIENNVTNWTYSNAKVRRSVKVGVDYRTSSLKTRDLLLGIVSRHGNVLTDPPPRVLLDEFGADALIFNIQYWIDYASAADASLVASDLRFMIETGLSEAGISIPFPQRVIHIEQNGAPPPPPGQV